MILAIIMSIENDDNRQLLLEIYQEYYPLIKSKAYKVVKDFDTAEDMVQETIVKLVPHLPKLQNFEKPLLVSYICKTATSVSLDYYRRSIRRKKNVELQVEDVELDSLVDDQPSPAEVLEGIEDIRILGVAISQLSERDRDLLYYKYNMDYTDKQIAELLGMEHGAIRTALNRARNRAKDRLMEKGVGM